MIRGHDDALTRFERIGFIVDRDDPLTVKRRDERVACRGVRADALSLGKSKECDAESLVLDERLADDLPLCVCDLLFEQKCLLMLDVV